MDVTFEFDEADLVEEYYQLLKDDLKQTIRDNEPPALVVLSHTPTARLHSIASRRMLFEVMPF